MTDPVWKKIALSDLVLDERNARKHGAVNRATVRSSLEEFGQVETIVVQAGTGLVLGGNCRVEELRQLGVEEAMACEVDVQGAKAKRLALVLNRSAELADWDDDFLADALREIDADDELSLEGIGWDEDELADILNPGDGWDQFDNLPDDEPEFRTMTFTLTGAQVDSVEAALRRAKDLGDFGDTGNKNGNGNALARVAEMFNPES